MDPSNAQSPRRTLRLPVLTDGAGGPHGFHALASDGDGSGGGVLTRPLGAAAGRDLCTDCGLSRTAEPRRCGRACQFVRPDYPGLEAQVHGRARDPERPDEIFFGPFRRMLRAALDPPREGAQWTGITTRIGERLLATGAVDAVLTVAPDPADRWRPVPVLVTRPEDMAAVRGMRMGYAPLLALLEPARDAGYRRLLVIGIPCQVYALRALGYGDQDVEFCSHLTSLHQPSLVQSVEFTESPRRATVLLNTGLLATQSPLPGYFLRFLEEHPDSALADLLAFFAHPLLRRMVLAQAAELDAFGPSFTPTRLRTLELLGLRSPSTIHWLFQAAFPELSVVVRRGRERVAFPCQSVRLGHTAFGDGSSFGAVAYTLLPGIEVVLHSEEPRCRTGQHTAARHLRVGSTGRRDAVIAQGKA